MQRDIAASRIRAAGLEQASWTFARKSRNVSFKNTCLRHALIWNTFQQLLHNLSATMTQPTHLHAMASTIHGRFECLCSCPQARTCSAPSSRTTLQSHGPVLVSSWLLLPAVGRISP